MLYTVLTLCNCRGLNGALYWVAQLQDYVNRNKSRSKKRLGSNGSHWAGIVQLILIAVLRSDSSLTEISIVNEKGILGSLRKTVLL